MKVVHLCFVLNFLLKCNVAQLLSLVSTSSSRTYVGENFVGLIYALGCYMVEALYGCELWNTYSKQDINNLEKAHRFCVKHVQQFVKRTSTYFSWSCINLVTTETFIDFKKLQLLGQLCRLPCRHLSKSVTCKIYEW